MGHDLEDFPPPPPRRPFISTGAAAWASITVMFCAFVWLCAHDPEAGRKVVLSVTFGLVVLIAVSKA